MARKFSKSFYASTAWKKCRKQYIASVGGLCEALPRSRRRETGLYCAPQNQAHAVEHRRSERHTEPG